MLWLLRLLGFLYPVVAAVCLTLLGAMLVHQPPETRGFMVGWSGSPSAWAPRPWP